MLGLNEVTDTGEVCPVRVWWLDESSTSSHVHIPLHVSVEVDPVERCLSACAKASYLREDDGLDDTVTKSQNVSEYFTQ